MWSTGSKRRKYVFAIAFGVIAGGLVVTLATRAIPKMMARMREEGCNPAKMCERMMSASLKPATKTD